MNKTPRIVELLVGLFLPGRVRESVLGDLAEEHALAVPRLGRRRAGLWYAWQGLSLAGAYGRERLRRPLRRDLGEPVRTDKGDGTMRTLWQDLRAAARMMGKRPGFTAVALLTLALGIGANTAIFSVVEAVLLRPLPFPEPERLVQLWESNAAKGWKQNILAPANFYDWADRNEVFESIAAYEGSNTKAPGVTSVSLTGMGDAERLQGLGVTGGFFGVLGVPALLGRTIQPEDDKPEAPRVVVLSHGLWQRRFGSDPGVVGRNLVFNGSERTVVGVMPPVFRFPNEKIELWVPLRLDVPKVLQSEGMRRGHWLWAIARLKHGIAPEAAQAELGRIAAELERQYPRTNTGMGAGLTGMQEWMIGDVRVSLLVLLGAVGLVLLIACANIANLMLAQAAGRTRELAIRSALGASGRRLAGQMLAESLLLAACGGALGLLLAHGCLELLMAWIPPELPRLGEIGIDASVLGFAAITALVTGVLFGLLPALGAARPDVLDGLKPGTLRRGSGLRRGWARAALVVGELAFSLVLVLGAALLLQSLLRLHRVDPGFRKDGVLTLELSLPGQKYPEDAQVAAFYRQLAERLEALPSVRAAGAVSLLPIRGSNWTSDYTLERGIQGTELRHKVITPHFLEAMGLTLLAGRTFKEADSAETARVILVNEALARHDFPGQDPVGKKLKFGRPDLEGPWRTIVGVVADSKQDGLSADVRPEVYQPHQEQSWSDMTVVVRSIADPASLAGPVRAVLREMDPDALLYNVQTMDEVLSGSLARERFMTLLLGVFGTLALVLAAVGVYGVIAYMVSQSTKEIGIRMALGATRGDVLRLVVGQGMALAGAGVALGLGGAIGLSRFLESLLFEVSTTDPLTFAVVPLVLAAVAVAACYVPARRAMRVDPMIALRYE